MNTVKIALVAATAATLALIGCASEVPDETQVQTQQESKPELYTGAIIGSSGTIVQINPGDNNPPQPVVVCPGACTRASDGIGCQCPHGFGVKSGYVCPYPQAFRCFNGYCACYN